MNNLLVYWALVMLSIWILMLWIMSPNMITYCIVQMFGKCFSLRMLCKILLPHSLL
jgi:hypothetical protein